MAPVIDGRKRPFEVTRDLKTKQMQTRYFKIGTMDISDLVLRFVTLLEKSVLVLVQVQAGREHLPGPRPSEITRRKSTGTFLTARKYDTSGIASKFCRFVFNYKEGVNLSTIPSVKLESTTYIF